MAMYRSVELPCAPAVAGLTFRYARGPEDADALSAIHKGRAAHDRIEPLSDMEDFPSRDGLATQLASARNEGTLDQWLIAEVDRAPVGEPAGAPVGYSYCKTWPENDGTRVYLTLGWVLPEWRGQGIGSAMLAWTEARMRRAYADEHPGEKAELAANASDTETDATALLLTSGYRVAYNVLALKLDRSAPRDVCPLPPGLDVRPALPEHIPAISACVTAAYRHEYEGGRYDESTGIDGCILELSAPKFDLPLWQVAWDGERVVGQVLPVLTSHGAEIYEVSVHPDWRRRGLARSLLGLALDDLHDRSIGTVMIHTVEDFRTHAKDLYASMGFRLLKRFPRYRKPW
jgi:mycothiol synthase